MRSGTDGYDFVIEVDPGNDVICDYCNADYSSSDESGGMISDRWAVCPMCMPNFGHGREDYPCPPGVSFADFIRFSRKGIILQ
ncbi:hypothetical protein CcI6DRAFT_02872 [Frankia sp. CcI6]|uniref:hypothetical protein n=1 Tax=Frankia TaxID=1854 RepID=UPI0003CFF411|nr:MULTISPECIES: hypothetical protein [Frankia]ETA01692.1 hypothetical protein CcI6DRAFT_02872 [Frankia sp. CcI6]KFB03866.1 hypothetical protein ALLO2DRAFT_03382 [Frankia sp. Allo2]OAA29084.1 hypothetical protein AAY23_101717 [Frankia casuarinae]OHV48523.1 hypothetical protein CgIS1_05800 [Frankia sp. CgIS1]